MLHERSFDAFLFDMDGTLIDSIASANRIWRGWAIRHGLDPAPVMAAMHGVRAEETVRRYLPHGDIAAEVAAIEQAEIEDVDGIVCIAGARDLLAALPAGRWAIVTSASRALARARLAAAGLTPPPVMVTADDVARGKPEPDCFQLAARRLGFAPADCLVWEDTRAGITAAEAAGCAVMVITATHSHRLDVPHPSVRSYVGLRVVVEGDGRLRVVAGQGSALDPHRAGAL